MLNCYLCNKDITNEVYDEHHIIPQSRNGKNGKVVKLCSTCHKNIHAQALSILYKTNKEYFTNYSVNKERLNELLNGILSTYDKVELKTFTKVYLDIPIDMYNRIKIYKKDKNFKNINATILHLLKLLLYKQK